MKNFYIAYCGFHLKIDHETNISLGDSQKSGLWKKTSKGWRLLQATWITDQLLKNKRKEYLVIFYAGNEFPLRPKNFLLKNLRRILTNTKFLILDSKWSLFVGDVDKTYSTIFTPRPPVSDDLGDNILAVSLPGKLPDLRGTIEMGCDTAWSESKNHI